MSTSFAGSNNELKWRKDFDALDDRLHEVHRQDVDFHWPKFRRSKVLPVLGVLALLLIIWKAWPARSRTAVDWSRVAYVQYATDEHNLCNALMVFEALKRHGSRAQRVLLHHPQWSTKSDGGQDLTAELLTKAESKYRVKLKPVQILDSKGQIDQAVLDGQPSTWDTSVTKLHAFELTKYERVLVLDSDITLFDHLDELFLLPKTPMAAPRAHWMDVPAGHPVPLTSLILVLQPNVAELQTMLDTLQSWRQDPDLNITQVYDMELINHRFASSALVLPHRPYALLTAEFRQKEHGRYLGTINGPNTRAQAWDADKALAEAKLVHFSDWPLPKPWIMWPPDGLAEMQPSCIAGQKTCREREIWKELYADFRKRRKDICGIVPVRAPRWATWKHAVGA